LLIVPHPPKEEYHLGDIISLTTYTKSFLQIVEIASSKEGHQAIVIVFGVQLHNPITVWKTILRVLVKKRVEVHVEVLRLDLELFYHAVNLAPSA
jgi:hypothetical protein